MGKKARKKNKKTKKDKKNKREKKEKKHRKQKNKKKEESSDSDSGSSSESISESISESKSNESKTTRKNNQHLSPEKKPNVITINIENINPKRDEENDQKGMKKNKTPKKSGAPEEMQNASPPTQGKPSPTSPLPQKSPNEPSKVNANFLCFHSHNLLI